MPINIVAPASVLLCLHWLKDNHPDLFLDKYWLANLSLKKEGYREERRVGMQPYWAQMNEYLFLPAQVEQVNVVQLSVLIDIKTLWCES